nr:MAG TPA: hypothetical protein [Caudoviricetes sp.]
MFLILATKIRKSFLIFILNHFTLTCQAIFNCVQRLVKTKSLIGA